MPDNAISPCILLRSPAAGFRFAMRHSCVLACAPDTSAAVLMIRMAARVSPSSRTLFFFTRSTTPAWRSSRYFSCEKM
jgi:hypothetical protein